MREELLRVQPTISLQVCRERIFEVIVLGAGPAGSACASYLAQQGVDVLLIDQSAFPRQKACGDAVMHPALDELDQLQMRERVLAQAHAIDSVAMSHGGVEISRNSAIGCVIPRTQFDLLLLNKAVSTGAAFLDRCFAQEVVFCEELGIVEVRGVSLPSRVQWKIGAKILIVANGSGSQIARQIRQDEEQKGSVLPPPHSPRWYYVARRAYYKLSSHQTQTLSFSMAPEEHLHYGWVFPLGNGIANVGVIATLTQQAQANQAKLSFARSIERFAEGGCKAAVLQGEMRGAPLATGLRGMALSSNHIVCIGDAAALIEPHFGEGISGALWSARIAAMYTTMALKAQMFSLLSLYEQAVKDRYTSWLSLPD